MKLFGRLVEKVAPVNAKVDCGGEVAMDEDLKKKI